MILARKALIETLMKRHIAGLLFAKKISCVSNDASDDDE